MKSCPLSLSRRRAVAGFLGVAAFAAGCDPLAPNVELPLEAPPPDPLVGDSSALRTFVDKVLRQSYARKLDVRLHGAWQILHAVLPFKQDLPLIAGGKTVNAMEYILGGGRMHGWRFEPGIVLDPDSGRRGLRSIMQPGEKIGEGHVDQWLGYMSGCDLPLDQTIVFDNQTYTFESYLQQIEHDVSRNTTGEYTWTLMALAKYRPTDYTWTADDGDTWSFDRLIEWELEQDLNRSACGGSHRMCGVTLAANRRRADGMTETGVWENLRARINACLELARRFQNQDGSLSSHYWDELRPSVSGDLKKRIEATGHTLEFVALAASDDELAAPWVEGATESLCRDLDALAWTDVECGALYHAASALRIYYERRFGAWSFGATA